MSNGPVGSIYSQSKLKRITGRGLAGWVALLLALVNNGRPIATEASQFPPAFRCYLPWNECEEVTFDTDFNHGGSRLMLSLYDSMEGKSRKSWRHASLICVLAQ